MSWIDRIFSRPNKPPSPPPPPPSPPCLERWPGGTTVIDLRKSALDRATFSGVTGELSRLGPPRLRVWQFSTPALRECAENAAAMQELLQNLHAASLGLDESGKRAPDVAVLAGDLDGVMGAVYLLWSLGVAPFPLGDDGELPVIEAKTRRGEWIAGPHGEPLGEEPPKTVLRGVNLTRDKIEAEGIAADVEEESARVLKLLEIATRELSFIQSVLQSHD